MFASVACWSAVRLSSISAMFIIATSRMKSRSPIPTLLSARPDVPVAAAESFALVVSLRLHPTATVAASANAITPIRRMCLPPMSSLGIPIEELIASDLTSASVR